MRYSGNSYVHKNNMQVTYQKGYEPKDKHLCRCASEEKMHGRVQGQCTVSVKNGYELCYECYFSGHKTKQN